MNKTSIAALIISVLALILSFVHAKVAAPVVGGISNYDSLYLAGTSGLFPNFSVASSSPSALGDAVIDGTGTTTVMVASSAANTGGCLQFENDAGTQTKVYIHGTSWVIAAGSCK